MTVNFIIPQPKYIHFEYNENYLSNSILLFFFQIHNLWAIQNNLWAMTSRLLLLFILDNYLQNMIRLWIIIYIIITIRLTKAFL